jgi:hypothetical protein
MPTCTCGCGVDLTRRAITNHLQGQAVPRLVTAVVKARQTLAPSVNPPQLNLSKKLRSSRRYFPSSPTSPAVNEELGFIMSEDGDAGNEGSHEEEDAVDEAGVQVSINAAREDVWSGLHHDDDDSEDEYDDVDDEGEAQDDGDDDAEGGSIGDDSYDELGDDENGLSALHMMGEDFERRAVANGECTGSSQIQIPTYIIP